ncbi:hypothetical protein [Nitrosovibrio tenuis]|uniref:Uncharacterized protein n=1 Tax=Nitrosovibrio tenuis TaxID=1233 RepID=A0A1H7KDN6_9PROT|nr:hypothetical protein [Nitrosovibrio tenuis]SEK84057.1 hypothetical protein SAMN05216387_103169 [Nitrosovibrio tenuis]
MKSSIVKAKSLVLASTLVFTMTSAGLVHAGGAGERDIPDEISPTDVGVRDTDGRNTDRSIKERLHMKEGKSSTSTSTKKRDNSRYSTDGIERYEEDKGSSGTGPKREDRY